jgi:thiosulfate/3-mercaptopyruvate sulfurtransferase
MNPPDQGSSLLTIYFRRAGTVAWVFAILALTPLLLKASPAKPSDDQQPPWQASEAIEPAALAKILDDPHTSHAPIIACVGFHTLYEGAHIRGASFHGAASSPQGLADLKKWANSLPRKSDIVIYCGCCPLAHCPNVRPAFIALRDMGFTRVRVLILPHDFATDWVQPGYPIAKGK